MAPTPDEDGSADEGQVLSPEDLDIANDDNVASLDDGRYVIAPEGKNLNRDVLEEKAQRDDVRPDPAPTEDSKSPIGTSAEHLDSETVQEWLETDVREAATRYGFRITAASEGSVDHQQLFSDDVGTVFDGLLLWYAQQLDRETPVEDVLGILLLESNVRIRFPVRAFTSILKRHGLGADDTISDFFDAVYDGTGVVFPPERAVTDDD